MFIILVLIFSILTIFSVRYFESELGSRKVNKGFLILTLMISTCNIICAVLVFLKSIAVARYVLLIYYLVHAWLLPSLLYMISRIERVSINNKKTNISIKPAIIVGVLQTILVAAGFKWDGIFEFENKAFILKNCVVAVNPDNAGYMPDYGFYNVLIFVNVLFALYVLFFSRRYGPKMFYARYLIFITVIVMFALIELITIAAALPVWIQAILYNAIYVVASYLGGDYETGRLREWSLDNFADNMGDGLILYDRAGVLIHINSMVRRSLHTDLIVQFSDRSKLDEWLKANVDKENSQVVRYEGPDRVYYLQPHVQELTDNDIPIGTLYILHDHSESYNSIMAMRKSNEELERAGRMKSDFLANMSHEIRTPMNAVIGMAELAMRDDDPERVEDYLRQIRSSGKNLLNIINDILDYSKIESGKMEIIEEKYCPFEELSDIAAILAVRIADKPVELLVIVEGVLPHMLIGDSMRVRQVLINLANNAIKFTEQGMVVISITSEKLNDDHMELTFHVIDTGIGIRDEDKNKLFESFQQVDSKRNRSVEGTGLGLAISRRLVGAMGGEMGVESEYGKGSDFWFTITQKIVDEHNDIQIDNASGKRAFILEEDSDRGRDEFIHEMERMGVNGEILRGLDSYTPSDTIDFIFTDSDKYDDKMRSFLRSHPDVRGIVFTHLDEELSDDLPNVHEMRRPKTTMNMVRTLNEKYDETFASGEGSLYEVDFSAPDARVLVADDNEINLTIAGGLLASMDIVPDYAHGGQEAVEMALSGDYDIVFMDHMMPEVDGVEATIAIRKELNSMVHPVIIALSANVMEEARKLFKSSGMNDFVGKPIDLKNLAEKVKKYLPEDKIKAGAPGEKKGSQATVCAASLINYKDLDTDTALKALGNTSLYDKILEEYYRSGEDKYRGIENAYESEDWSDYTIRVHALKSSSRQVGALTLGDMAEKLEKAGKASDLDTIRSRTGDTLKEYRAFLDALGEHYEASRAAEDAAPKPPIDPESLSGLLVELKSACDDLDMDRMEAVSESLKGYSYNEDLRPLIDDLLSAIDGMDTEKCEELCLALSSGPSHNT